MLEKFFHYSYLICLGYFLALNAYHFLILFVSWAENRLRTRQEKRENYEQIRTSDLTIPISVIIPAYNEEVLIVDTVLSVLRNGYPNFEVIVVNDGSTDGTLNLLKREFKLEQATRFYRKTIPTKEVRGIYRSSQHPNLFVVDKVNGESHADATNVGINLSRYRYLLCVDADTILEEGALLKTVRLALRNPREVVGVGSTIGIGNGFEVRRGVIRNRGLTAQPLVNLQMVEFFRTFLLNRLGWSRGNFNVCVSGALGLWRRDVIIEMGGFQGSFTCDDLEMTFRVHHHFRSKKIPYQILSMPDPVCWTEAPASTYGFYLQRHRWQESNQ